jgi:haloacetate dehalogenase
VIEGFRNETLVGSKGPIAYSIAGSGPALILLHGFPQNRFMWHQIAPELAKTYRVICPDLRGYGGSAKPLGVENYSFREMGADILHLMDHLDLGRAHLIGHDRGARVSHRLALDAPERLKTLTLMDIVPTHTLFSNLSREVALGYYHWFFLALPAPFPDNMIGHDPDTYFNSCLTGLGTGKEPAFNDTALAAYRTAWRDPETIRAMCDDYRAGATLDFEQDAKDLDQRVTLPSLVLYAKDGMMDKTYKMHSVWSDKLSNFAVKPMRGGHFFPDHYPQDTLTELRNFLEQNS